MTQQDTQPPAETLADYRSRLAVALFEASYNAKFIAWSDETRDHWLGRADAALTRRAGGDAIPAGMALNPTPLEKLADSMAGDDPVGAIAVQLMRAWAKVDPRSGVAQCPISYVATFTDMARAVIATTPKPPAGGDAGAVGLDRATLMYCARVIRDRAVTVSSASLGGGYVSEASKIAARHLITAVEDMDKEAAALALPAPVVEVSRDMLAEVMQDAWGEICDDAAAHPSDMQHGRGTVLFYRPAHWTDLIALRLNERLAALSEGRSHG